MDLKNIVPFVFLKQSVAFVSKNDDYNTVFVDVRTPLLSSGQTSWLQTQRSRVRVPALPDFLSSSGSGTGTTQTCEVK
jgi:hypothetical protein